MNQAVISTPKRIDQSSIWYQVLLLAISATAASGILLAGYQMTADTIALRHYEDQLAAFNQVIDPKLYVNELIEAVAEYEYDGIQYTVYTAYDLNQRVSAYAIRCEAMGYAGPIVLLLGLDAGFEIMGVRVLSHTETPGLGDRIEIAKSDWIDTFIGHSLNNTDDQEWAVKKDGGRFDQFTGATITPRAIVQQIHRTLNFSLDTLGGSEND